MLEQAVRELRHREGIDQIEEQLFVGHARVPAALAQEGLGVATGHGGLSCAKGRRCGGDVAAMLAMRRLMISTVHDGDTPCRTARHVSRFISSSRRR
jgi:hypothetical protein